MNAAAGERGLLTEMVQRFSADRIRPIAGELDATERFPEEIYAEMGSLGLLGITVPGHLGGSGGSAADYAAVVEELAVGYASVADQCGLVELVTSLLAEFGTPNQQQRWLPGLIAGTQRCAYALTESEAGSDLGAIRTVAERHGGREWVLTGEKIFIHNAPIADLALVLAVTDKARAKRGGMSMFLVDCRLPGVTRARREHKMGQRASPVGTLAFREVPLGADALLGEEGAGFGAVLSMLEKGRVGIAALATGILRAAIELSVDHAVGRVQFGRPLAEFQGVGFPIANMITDYHAARLLYQEAAEKLDAASPDAGTAASMAKLFASEAAVRHTSAAVQIHGGSGYIHGVEVERLFRDARVTTIYEGTSEIQRMIISRAYLSR
jgi:alkylation response protein AidB-like acyl-CoA dehydrogenase